MLRRANGQITLNQGDGVGGSGVVTSTSTSDVVSAMHTGIFAIN